MSHCAKWPPTLLLSQMHGWQKGSHIHILVSPSTMSRAIKKLGIERKSPTSKPLLTIVHKQKRLSWCLKHQNTDWSKVVFTDESTLRMAPFRQQHMVKKGAPRP